MSEKNNRPDQAKTLPRKTLEQRNILLLEEDEDDDGSGGASGGWKIPLPEEEYYDVHEIIREQHDGKVDPARKPDKTQSSNNTSTSELQNEAHPLAAMAYFSGMDNQKETPLPGESTDREIQDALQLELKKRLQLQNQPSATPRPSTTPRPRPF